MDIFVAKLSSDTTPDHLNELFSQFGNVVSTKVIMDRETGRSKCYGFVEMDNNQEGSEAIENLNESDFMGSTIAVKESQPRTQERRSFDNRRGGGGGRRFDGGGGNRRYDRDSRYDRGGDRGGDRRNYNRDRDFNKYE